MEAYLIHVAIITCISAILSMGFNLTAGYAGLVNLGYVGLYGIGAYTTAILVKQHHLPFAVGVIAAMLIAGIVSALLTLPLRKIKTEYFSLITLGFHFIAGAVFINWISLTRGTLGIAAIPRPQGFVTNDNYLILVFIIAIVVYIFLSQIVKSPFGRALEATRDDEEVAAALGKPVFKLRLVAMIISGALAGLSGALLAHFIQFISPTSFLLDPLVWCIAAVIIGGLASMEGAVLGMILLYALSEPLRFLHLPSDLIGPLRIIIFMSILAIFVLWKPKGLLGRAELDT